ncbi:MAG: THUMP domain-containing protein [Leptospirillia bacterium]
MSDSHRFFATCARNMEPLLGVELRAIGLSEVKETRLGVGFSGPVSDGYRACLWSRIASRVLLPLHTFPCGSPEELYDGVRRVAWEDHLGPENTLAVDFSTSRSAVDHSRFGAMKVKDAIVDHMRDAFGSRPSVDRSWPDLRVNVYLYKDQATVSIDLSGEALHRRGYRVQGGQAPLKENLAAAILASARWPAMAAEGRQLVDLMCGTGTLLIEGVMMATDTAPGLFRQQFGFETWRPHDIDAWDELLDEAEARRQAGLARQLAGDIRIHGYDSNRRMVDVSEENLGVTGLEGCVTVAERALRDAVPHPGKTGLVVINPPYGERMGSEGGIEALYTSLGAQLKSRFSGWRAAVFTGNAELAYHMGLRPDRKNTLYNGPLECKLLHYGID